MKLLIGTRNRKKLAELKALLDDLPVEVLDLDNVDCDIDVVEDGDTLEANAAKKAVVYSRATGLVTVADDSGLEVDALSGRPGVHSARYAGAEQNDEANIAKLLRELEGAPSEKRTARFRTVAALADDGGLLFAVSGSVEGVITEARHGSGGFGYDPVFHHPPSGCTFAELSAEKKNAVSHRRRALEAFKERFREWLSTGR